MAVDSTSTIAQIVAAIADNASYQENDSLTEAKAFVSAARLYIFKVPKRQKNRSSETELDVKELRAEMKTAQDWIRVKGGDTSHKRRIVHPSFDGFRS